MKFKKNIFENGIKIKNQKNIPLSVNIGEVSRLKSQPLTRPSDPAVASACVSNLLQSHDNTYISKPTLLL